MADSNGYNPSLLQSDQRCYLCGRTNGKLDRHEIFPGANREKSKYYGLWVLLCDYPCHHDIAHRDGNIARSMKEKAQGAAMKEYGWTKADFIRLFGKNYL